jgi:hypothetical protein
MSAGNGLRGRAVGATIVRATSAFLRTRAASPPKTVHWADIEMGRVATPKENCERLLNATLAFAEQMHRTTSGL